MKDVNTSNNLNNKDPLAQLCSLHGFANEKSHIGAQTVAEAPGGLGWELFCFLFVNIEIDFLSHGGFPN